ncbi:hypothetical protein D3C78_1239170 [compost metagenome]
MQQADRDRFNALPAQGVEYGWKGFKVQRGYYFTAIIQAFTDFQTQMTRHERRRLAVVGIENIRCIAPGNLQHIAKSTGGQQGGFDTLAFGQGVDHHGRAMGEKLDVGITDATFRDRIEQSLFKVRRCSVGLDRVDHAVFQVNQVSKSATDIGSHTDCHKSSGNHAKAGQPQGRRLLFQKVWETVKIKRPSLRRYSPLL